MPRKEPERKDGPTYVTVGLYAEEVAAMNRIMRQWRVSQSAAIRLLISWGNAAGPPRHDHN